MSETMTLSGLQSWARAQAAGYSDFSVPMNLSAESLVAATKRAFVAGMSPTGAKWKPISELTMTARRTAHTYFPLRDSGRLMGSITGQGEGSGHHIQDVTKTSATVGTNLTYASTHQEGATIRPVKAKALAVPLTSEAAKYGSPLRFPPGRLKFIRPAPGKVGKVRGYFYEVVGGVVKGGKKGRRGTGGAGYERQIIVKENQEQRIFHYMLTTQVDIPARPFLGFNQAMIEKLEKIWDFWLDKQLRGKG